MDGPLCKNIHTLLIMMGIPLNLANLSLISASDVDETPFVPCSLLAISSSLVTLATLFSFNFFNRACIWSSMCKSSVLVVDVLLFPADFFSVAAKRLQ